MSNRVSFTCTADPRDVLTAKAASGKDLIGELIAAMKNAVPGDLQVTKKGFNSFSISLPGGENEEDVMKRLRDAAGEVCRNLNVHETHIRSDAEEAEAEPGKANEPEAGETAGETPAEQKQGGSGRNAGSAYDAILSLVGAEEIKAWAEKVHGVSKERGDRPVLESALTGMSYLLAVDPGNGCTTILERMGALIAETLGRNGCTLKEEFPVFEEDKDNLQPIEREVSRIPEGNRLTLYAVHLDSYLSRLHTERFSLFLRRIRKAGKKIVFAFVVPMLEDSALNRILSDLEDTSACRVLRVRPYSDRDLICFCERYLSEAGLTVSVESYPFLLKKAASEKRDGKFYGADTIRKICDEILYERILSGRTGPVVTPEDVRAVLPEEVADDGTPGWEQLDRLIALGTVKEKVRELCASIRWERENAVGRPRSMHMMFSGAPGTGKTAVARIVGKILREEGILARGELYEVSRKDLVGRYVGHTAPKTAEVCRMAYDSVLFIDEAYALAGGSDNDYGKEAVSTLIAEMENHRDRLVMIFAGYEKELEKLFDLNPGLRDRVPYHIRFPNYTRDELAQIFFTMIPKEMTYGEEFKVRAESYFRGLPDSVLESPNFSNARFVRNVAERVVSKATLRLYDAEPGDRELKESDFELAVADAEFRDLIGEKRKRPIGFF